MYNVLDVNIPEKDLEDIKEFVLTIIPLSAEGRAILLSNANALRARQEIEKKNQQIKKERGR